MEISGIEYSSDSNSDGDSDSDSGDSNSDSDRRRHVAKLEIMVIYDLFNHF